MEIEKINKAIELIQAGNSIRKTAKILEEAYTTIRYYTYDYAIKRESLNYNRDFFETIDSEKKAYCC
jgi:molybdate-binding protein